MSDTTDVKALTQNVKTVFKTSAACDRVKIHNNSSMYLRVYFGADAPNDPTVGAGWHTTIDPGDKPVMGIVGAQSNPFSDRSYIQSTTYQGTITVMPFLPANNTQAGGGVVTGGAFCHMTAYYAGELAEDGSADEAYVQAVKQARYADVTGAVERYIVSIGNTDATANLQTASGGGPIRITPASCPGLFAWAARVKGTPADNTAINVYYYGTHADWSNTAAGAASCVWRVEAVIRDPTDAFDIQVETLGLYRFGSAAAIVGGEHLEDKLPHPAIVTLVVAGPGLGGIGIVNNLIFRIRYIRIATAGTWEMRFNTDVLFDGVNQNPCMDKPYWPVFFTGPTDFTYDPQGNPQTW